MKAQATQIYDQFVMPLQIENNTDWVGCARLVAEQLALSYGTITIDDVRRVFPPPHGTDPRVMGTVFRPKTKWKKIGYRDSARSTCHGRPIAVWALLK